MVRQETTIPSRALEVWRRLYVRFSLEPGPASLVPDVSKTIWPVTSVDLNLRRSRGEAKNLDLSVAGGTFVAARTVPDGETWYLTTIGQKSSVQGTGPAMKLGTNVVEFSDDATGAVFITLRHQLNAGDAIGAMSSGDAGDNARGFFASWEEEDV